ncbi:hypothetical protein AB4Y67_12670 [Arthrobacter sp. YAF17]|uniref:hypothetical protein n=1 Tax=Arthrobacter sp. YAF17 TaxID=3233077 RepID=UPI003F8F2802
MPGEVVHPEKRAVHAQFLGGDGQFDALQQGFAGGPGAGTLAGSPMAEGQESDALHVRGNTGGPGGIPGRPNVCSPPR